MEKRPDLTARQALIAAAVADPSDEVLCPWPSPIAKSDLLAYARWYQPNLEAADLDRALDALISEGCFHAVRYPIFQETILFCAYWSEFLKELPDPVSAYICAHSKEAPVTREELTNFWESTFAEYSDQWGASWVYWGMCTGQGSQGPSGAPIAPCLGPSCCWYEDGKSECNWGLKFRKERPSENPNMEVLDWLNQEQWKIANQDAFCSKALRQMGYHREADAMEK